MNEDARHIADSIFPLEESIRIAYQLYLDFREFSKSHPRRPLPRPLPERPQLSFDAFGKGENISVFFHIFQTELAPDSPSVGMHRHDFYEINYVYRGSVTNSMEDQVIHQTPDSILLMNPYASHRPQVDTPDTILFNILIRREFSAQMLGASSFQNNHLMELFLTNRLGMSPMQPYLLFETTPKIALILHEMIQEYYQKRPYYQQVLYAKFVDLWSAFARQREEQKVPDQAPLSDHMEQILSFIQQHCQSVSLEETARKFGFSSSSLSRYINTQAGYPFNKIVQHFRLQKAMSYLLYSNIPVAEIAELVGYNDLSYFRKVFKKATGISPSLYRCQEQDPLPLENR